MMEALTVWETLKLTFWEKFSREGTRVKTQSFSVSFLISLPLHSLETTACLPLKTDERKMAAAGDTRVDTVDRNGCIKGKGRKHHSHRRARRWDGCYARTNTGSAREPSRRFSERDEKLKKIKILWSCGIFFFFFVAKRLWWWMVKVFICFVFFWGGGVAFVDLSAGDKAF